jgi:CheY-like chemotaxis protein
MSKRILIADDSSVIQTLTKKILITLDYEVTGVKNGNKVLPMVEENDFDIILMDINLPSIDGISLTKQIRALSDKKNANTPVIAISGNYKNYSEDDFRAIGIEDLLVKPLNYDDLVEAINKYSS